MFVDINSLKVKISGGNYIALAPYLVEAEFQYPKLWSSDSGRNLAGVQSGTLIGIFPKLVCQFRPLTQTELHTLAPIFDSASQTVQYFDINANAIKTITTYTGDWTVKNQSYGKNEGFQISFISTRKRS